METAVYGGVLVVLAIVFALVFIRGASKLSHNLDNDEEENN